MFDNCLTLCYHRLMENQMITSREFVRNFAALSKKKIPAQYTILRHGKPLGRFIPFPHYQKSVTLEDLEAFRFQDREKNLSQKIDTIVYGMGRTKQKTH